MLDSQTQLKQPTQSKIQISIKKIDSALRSNPRKQIIEGVQTDIEFAEDILNISQFTKINRKQGDIHELTEEQYEFVQRTGQVHYEAQLFNQTTTMQTEADPNKRCKCCNKTGGESLSFCTDIQDQHYFGSAVVLFFYYNKNLFRLILMAIIVYGIYALTTNLVVGNATLDCSKPGALPFMCYVKIVTSLEGKKSRSDLQLIEVILGLLFCILWTIGIRIVRDRGRMKNAEIDQFLDSSADYWVMIEGFPTGQYSEKQVLQFMNDLWDEIDNPDKGTLKIKGIQICYKMDEVRTKITQIQDLSKEIAQLMGKKQDKYVISKQNVQAYQDKKIKVLKIYKQLIQFRQKFLENSDFRKDHTSSCIFVNFQSTKQQEIMVREKGIYRMTVPKQTVQRLKQSCCSKFKFPKYNDKYVKLIKAPEPSDVIWNHCEYEVEKKNILILWLINLLLILCSLAAFFFVRYIKQQNPDRNGLSSLGIITLNLFNRLIWNVLGKAVVIEKNHTKTDNLVSIMNKNYLASTANIIIVPLIVTGGVDQNFISPSGLTGTIHDYQITAFAFMMLFNLINVPYRISQLVRCLTCLRRSAIKNSCKIFGKLDTYGEMKQALTQVYEPPPLPIVGIYVFVTSTLMQAAFFCQGSPIVFFYMGVSMLLFMAINRWLLLKVCKVPDMIDFLIFQVCIGFAMNVPLFYGTGSLLLLGMSGYVTTPTMYIPSIICIVIWFVSILNPCGIYNKITSCCVNYNQRKVQSIDTEGREKNKNQGIELAGLTLNETSEKLMENEKKAKRKQNYYGNSSISMMFNFESQLQKAQGPFHGKTQEYCERHQLNMK